MSQAPLKLRVPPRRLAEVAWVCDFLFTRRLGLPFELQTHDAPEVWVETGAARVQWPDVFLARADACWLQQGSPGDAGVRAWPVPDAALRQRIGRDDVAVLFGNAAFEATPTRLQLPLDLSGSVFFMLSRYEEALPGAASDAHGRFPGHASLAGRHGLLMRALVDEWVELLWWALQQVAPHLQRVPQAPRVWATCDVDLAYSPGLRQPWAALRQTAAHLLKERSPGLALGAALNPLLGLAGVHALDPYDNFEWMMDTAEACGQRISFFFIAAQQATPLEGFYALEDPRIAGLVQQMRRRGHGVALHASYASVDDPALLRPELERLQRAAGDEGRAGEAWANRQHFLRWQAARTPAVLAGAGLAVDSTLAYADLSGFRCGTSHAFPLYDLQAGRALAVLEQPLVLMEGTVIGPGYMNLGLGPQARQLMLDLKQTCQRFGGCFTLLWHNTGLRLPAARRLYAELIRPYPGAPALAGLDGAVHLNPKDPVA